MGGCRDEDEAEGEEEKVWHVKEEEEVVVYLTLGLPSRLPCLLVQTAAVFHKAGGRRHAGCGKRGAMQEPAATE